MQYHKTKDGYEQYLNDLYGGIDLWKDGTGKHSYMNAPKLLRHGKIGTALRKHDSIAFQVGFDEWRNGGYD